MIAQIKNRHTIFIFILLTCISSSHADKKSTVDLHRSHCVGCHARMTGGDGTLVYKRDDSIVQNKQELRQRVTHCSNGAQTNWSESEITSVTNFLNAVIYNFSE